MDIESRQLNLPNQQLGSNFQNQRIHSTLNSEIQSDQQRLDFAARENAQIQSGTEKVIAMLEEQKRARENIDAIDDYISQKEIFTDSYENLRKEHYDEPESFDKTARELFQKAFIPQQPKNKYYREKFQNILTQEKMQFSTKHVGEVHDMRNEITIGKLNKNIEKVLSGITEDTTTWNEAEMAIIGLTTEMIPLLGTKLTQENQYKAGEQLAKIILNKAALTNPKAVFDRLTLMQDSGILKAITANTLEEETKKDIKRDQREREALAIQQQRLALEMIEAEREAQELDLYQNLGGKMQVILDANGGDLESAMAQIYQDPYIQGSLATDFKTGIKVVKDFKELGKTITEYDSTAGYKQVANTYTNLPAKQFIRYNNATKAKEVNMEELKNKYKYKIEKTKEKNILSLTQKSSTPVEITNGREFLLKQNELAELRKQLFQDKMPLNEIQKIDTLFKDNVKQYHGIKKIVAYEAQFGKKIFKTSVTNNPVFEEIQEKTITDLGAFALSKNIPSNEYEDVYHTLLIYNSAKTLDPSLDLSILKDEEMLHVKTVQKNGKVETISSSVGKLRKYFQ